MQYVHDLATITYYLPGDDVVNGGRRRRGSNQEEMEKEGGREGSSCWAEAGDSKEYYHYF